MTVEAVLFDFGVNWFAFTLQLPQDVRHADVGVSQIVPPRGFGVVTVVGTKVSVQIVSARAFTKICSRTRHQCQVRWNAAKPVFGILRIHRDFHRVADFVSREQQVVLDLLLC